MKQLFSGFLALLMLIWCGVVLLPSASAATSQANVLYENNFNDTSLASKTDESLAKALFGTGNYTYSSGGTLRIVDGALKITAGSSQCFEFLLCDDDAISDGVVVEAEYSFGSGTDADGKFLMFTPKRGLGEDDRNTLLAAAFNNMQSRVAWRDTTEKASWQWLHYSPDEKSSGLVNTKYKMRATFSRQQGVVLEVATLKPSGFVYGDYVTVGQFNESNLLAFQSKLKELPSMISDTLIMRVENQNIVTVDNLKVYVKPVEKFPAFAGSQFQEYSRTNTVDLRLVTGLKNLECKSAGYEITVSYALKNGRPFSKSSTVNCNYAYESITYRDGDNTLIRTAEDLCKGASYLFVLHIEDIPADLDATYEVTPFFVDEKGVKVTGKTQTIQRQDNAWDNEIPQYEVTKGLVLDDGEFSEEMYRTRVTNTSRAEYDAYRQKLVDNGFVLYSENTINSSHYATYKGKKTSVHVYYREQFKEARVLRAPVERMVDYLLEPVADEVVTTPSVALMSVACYGLYQGDNGAGFVFTMPDGSYVIIDGGYGVDTDTLYRYLRANNKRADGEILIRAWMITHYHEDHYGNFVNFAKSYAKAVKLEYFVANFDGGEQCISPQDRERVNSVVPGFEGVKYIVPQVGQVMYFGETKFEFLHTQERLYPNYRRSDANDHSLVAKVTFRGKTFMMMGDAYPIISGIDAEYGSYLKSDFVQAPHHGMGGTSNRFYDLVDADYAFINTSTEHLAERLASKDYGNYGALQYLIKTLKTPYSVASGGYQIITLE